MYSTVHRPRQFLSCLFAGGKVGDRQLLKPETLEEMFTPQFAKPRREGAASASASSSASSRARRAIGHGGAIYGFATELAALPDEKLGVVVVASRDVRQRGDDAHRRRRPAADARGEGRQAAAEDRTTDAARPPDEARTLAGPLPRRRPMVSTSSSASASCSCTPTAAASASSSAASGDDLIVDDLLDCGPTLDASTATRSRVGKTTYTTAKPRRRRRRSRRRSGTG